MKQENFASDEVEKIVNTDYYRAKLDYENRLLFKFARYNGQYYILLLEVIMNHNYSSVRYAVVVMKNDDKAEAWKFFKTPTLFLNTRGRDKADRSLDAYKFYINSLSVGVTQIIIYILSSKRKNTECSTRWD